MKSEPKLVPLGEMASGARALISRYYRGDGSQILLYDLEIHNTRTFGIGLQEASNVGDPAQPIKFYYLDV